uniref:Uncharacterized protein n=1 Tax=Chromera velia CCMP2878 TaxID=1169474 RepID=A0A0G4GL71_9ALVE|eukprot:Cvel_22407.t1-p1 / transcript=Cvel_22407.t1 / gene=Cvel_22407 / organism=Chromera_velia_CCMP2878 / gene_product=hypothetical protein / transcript_product=hypothetical protein / location=Cvel_scaffold2198:23631-29922(-) / protein_length=543 / sequence_SO=supercontig / SO=protein_coding / is_pseudo=false
MRKSLALALFLGLPAVLAKDGKRGAVYFPFSDPGKTQKLPFVTDNALADLLRVHLSLPPTHSGESRALLQELGPAAGAKESGSVILTVLDGLDGEKSLPPDSLLRSSPPVAFQSDCEDSACLVRALLHSRKDEQQGGDAGSSSEFISILEQAAEKVKGSRVAVLSSDPRFSLVHPEETSKAPEEKEMEAAKGKGNPSSAAIMEKGRHTLKRAIRQADTFSKGVGRLQSLLDESNEEAGSRVGVDVAPDSRTAAVSFSVGKEVEDTAIFEAAHPCARAILGEAAGILSLAASLKEGKQKGKQKEGGPLVVVAAPTLSLKCLSEGLSDEAQRRVGQKLLDQAVLRLNSAVGGSSSGSSPRPLSVVVRLSPGQLRLSADDLGDLRSGGWRVEGSEKIPETASSGVLGLLQAAVQGGDLGEEEEGEGEEKKKEKEQQQEKGEGEGEESEAAADTDGSGKSGASSEEAEGEVEGAKTATARRRLTAEAPQKGTPQQGKMPYVDPTRYQITVWISFFLGVTTVLALWMMLAMTSERDPVLYTKFRPDSR